jgi:hypothetical protein
MPVLKMKFRYALKSSLFGNVDLLMDLLCVSEADSTFKAYYAGFMRWKKLLRMVLTCWIYSHKADIIYQAFNASSENEIQICIKALVYQNCTRP